MTGSVGSVIQADDFMLDLTMPLIQATRDDVRAEVMKAPKRRIDNVITRLTDSVHLLQVHTTVRFCLLICT